MVITKKKKKTKFLQIAGQEHIKYSLIYKNVSLLQHLQGEICFTEWKLTCKFQIYFLPLSIIVFPYNAKIK